MKPEKEKYLEFPGEVYYFLLRLLEDNKASDGVKRRAIDQCLKDTDFSKRASKRQSEKWLKEQLTKKIATLITRQRALTLCGVGAAIVAGILVAIKPSPEKQSSPPSEHHDIVQNTLPVSPFSHESVMSQVMMPRFPNKPFHIADFPGTTLDEKIKIFIADRASLGDPTMKRIHDFIGGNTWEVYFCSLKEGQKILARHGKTLPPNIVVASASVWVIDASERKDGGKKGIGVVLLPPDDGIPEKIGIHRLAGTITNELTGVIVLFNNLTPPKEPGKFTISNDNTQYSAPEWMHQMAGMYVMQEALSHIADLVEETRVATGNPQYMPTGDELWGALCQSLKSGKFDKNDPENYARVYFGIGLEKIGLEQDIIHNPQYVTIMEHLYQRGVAFAIQEGNKEKFFAVLRFLGTIQ